jgi:hypothetical protein
MYEKVIFNRIQYHIVDANNILAQEQHGFRTKSSTEVATYNLVNNTMLALNGKFSVNNVVLRMASSGMLRRVALVRTEVSEELSTSFIRVTRIGELGTTLAVTSNRRTLIGYV